MAPAEKSLASYLSHDLVPLSVRPIHRHNLAMLVKRPLRAWSRIKMSVFVYFCVSLKVTQIEVRAFFPGCRE